MSVLLTIRLHEKKESLRVGTFIDFNEAEDRIKEILKKRFYRTNEKSKTKTYYPLHMIEKFEVTRIDE